MQDAFRALDDFAGFEFAAGFLGLFVEAVVFFHQLGAGDGVTHLLTDEAEERYFFRGVIARLAVVDIDDADDVSAADERNGQERFIGVFNQGAETFKAVVGKSIPRQSHHGLMFGHPTGDSLTDLHAERAQFRGVRELGGAEHDFSGVGFDQINEACVASRYLNREPKNFPEHLIKAQLGANNRADAVEKIYLRQRSFHFGNHFTFRLRASWEGGPIKILYGGYSGICKEMKLLVCWNLGAAVLLAQTLHGVVDIHAHSGPDSVPRSIHSLDVAKLAKARGFRAIVLKNHYEPTASLAVLAREAAPGLAVFGGIALNRSVGGVNPAAVERMTRVDGGYGRIVWMPTFDAENQVKYSKESRPFVSVSRNGKLLPEVNEVLDLIAKHKLVLATGHSAPAEVLLLVKEGRRRGIEHIVVTHGMLAPVGMSVAQMREATAMGAFIEFVSNAMIGTQRSSDFATYAQAMKQVGIESAILSSDLGQAGNPLHPDGLETVFAGLRSAGMTAAEIDRVAKQNPAKLLGLD